MKINYKEIEKFINEKIGNNIKEENFHMLGLIGGILYVLSTFLPLVTIKIPFFGIKIRLGITNLSQLSDFERYIDITKETFIIKIIALLFIINGVLVIYSFYIKKLSYLKNVAISSIGLFLVTFIYIFIQLISLEKDIRPYVGMSFAWFGFIISIILIVVSFILINQKK